VVPRNRPFIGEQDPRRHDHGTPPNDEKIDYLFFKQGYSANPVMGSGSPYDTLGGSDHKMLLGNLDLTT
jgi:hypothetical protein